MQTIEIFLENVRNPKKNSVKINKTPLNLHKTLQQPLKVS